ncbi:aspartate aminotransferase family protein [Paenibacillus sacheonensis]|uniref:glutamate-1-semialdehyde 2,1-aminomutase n=1 Tax=Paenibacillus sacheonensis TaxID=742054 RepID=A0A7X4YT42_9BACL|nr:aspartate aminotransferase family protein [Paenibacillus sacheonensis]MBM7568382.1 glutamate-1-semialdehyde 2,1-aminomutase [Paenibacillus sacheonensis]NBC72082.1 aminotransferase class III-fold pyridoxal phosphate-dependent enzyme [Paenibacillus sacheonensis]
MTSYSESQRLLAEASSCLAGGVASSLRAAMKPVPLYAASASGSRIRDVDGNEYIDYLLAYGPSVLGHAHPGLIERIHRAMQHGITFGLQHEGELALAKRLTEILPCADQVAFSGSGTEAVMLALRLARAYTGKRRIVRFHGHYHGWSDGIFTSFPSADMRVSGAVGGAADTILPGTAGQSESSLEDIILLPWNDEQAIESLLRDSHADIAAVITEPVMCNSGCIAPKPGYLEKLRELTAELGVVLIFDEVITGFRLALGGAQQRFGITPDLMTMGKALGGGIALSAVGGKRDIMKLIEDGTVSHLGTLNGSGVAMAAGLATIDELERNDGEALARMERLADSLTGGLRTLLEQHGIQGVVNGIGPVFHFMFVPLAEVTDFDAFSKRDSARYATFAELMLQEGVLVRPSGLWYVSAAHTEQDIAATLAAADRVLARLA